MYLSCAADAASGNDAADRTGAAVATAAYRTLNERLIIMTTCHAVGMVVIRRVD